MDTSLPLRMLPTISMLRECLEESGWRTALHISDEEQQYRGIRLYHSKLQLQKDVLYLLRPEENGFPVNEYTYLSNTDHGGSANHLVCPGQPDVAILDQIMEIFAQFQSWENAIDMLVYRGAPLQELCELGEQLMKRPVCFHDDWFVMMAVSTNIPDYMEPEYLMSSSRGFVPRAILEDFQDNSDYLETYDHHDAQVWITPDGMYKTMYVNLRDESVFLGRMLVLEMGKPFLRRDFRLAEILAQRAVLLLRRKRPGDGEIHQDMDDIVFSLLQGGQTEPSELFGLMNMLRWKSTDRFLCLRIRPQQSGNPAMKEHMLHSDLFHHFSGSYILLGHQEQCIVINLSQTQLAVPMVHHRLAPLCRDYCLYAGVSSPVSDIRELCAAYYQAGAALEQAFVLRDDKWIVNFSSCALEHIFRNLPSPLMANHLLSPELVALMEYDRQNGTAYFETLREYLLQDRDIPRTSQALIIHRTTLIYRLKKIAALFPVNLEDPWQRMQLILSLWILDREKEK